MYRTLINLVLSHVCLISIARCFVVRIPYVVMLFVGPCSITTCNVIIFLGRFFFLSVLTEIFLWQIIKYLYIFQWKHMVGLNDIFVANFVTMTNLVFSAVFILSTQMMQFHNAELDFHICTGNHPHVNIVRSQWMMSNLHNLDKPEFSLEEVAINDPLLLLTKVISFLLILILFQIWMYSKKELFARVWNKIVLKKTIATIFKEPNIGSVKMQKYDQFKKTKNAIIGARGSFAAISLMLILLVPSHISKSFAKTNAENINYGQGRVWTYVSRICLPIVSYCILPLVVITANKKMRKIIAREVKAKFIKLFH